MLKLFLFSIIVVAMVTTHIIGHGYWVVMVLAFLGIYLLEKEFKGEYNISHVDD